MPEVKTYEYELLETHAPYQPSDQNNTALKLGNGFPPLYSVPNSGVTLDEKSNARAWRLIQGQPSIWNDEQKGLDEMSKRQIDSLLSRPENKLEFRNGKLMVRSVEKLKIKALEMSDLFEGKKDQYQVKNRVYRLNNPDEMVNKALDKQAKQFEALKIAYDATTEEMLAYAHVIGINTDDQSEAGLNKIKSAFISQASLNPETFVELFSNPANKIKFTIKDAIAKGVISFSQVQNRLTWVQQGTEIMPVNGNGDVIGEVADKVIKKDKEAVKMYEMLQTLLAE